jgi:hypothetical protein
MDWRGNGTEREHVRDRERGRGRGRIKRGFVETKGQYGEQEEGEEKDPKPPSRKKEDQNPSVLTS